MGGLEILSENGGLAFGRGWRHSAEGRRSAVLVRLPTSGQPTPATLDRLAHEYSLEDELNSTWAVRPLELLQDRGRTILVLEDPGGELLGELLGTPMEMGDFLRIAVSVAAALGKMHERGLIHKDIKPTNILVNILSGEIRLTGFGIASRLPQERLAPSPPEFIAGTLPYMAPEQTGRMNRSIDSRSDLYSLGVTFYQMLTGALPFTASDPMEWVHCHIATTPMPPRERLGTIPAPISQLVMKLLAKTPEERYQTAAGVAHDLWRCRAEWEMRSGIDEFPLAERDVRDRLLIPEILYGRSHEVAALLGSFHRVVATGIPELVLVSGYSGIGKSSVVNELHTFVVPPRGLFASGKFDQYKRDVPYATLAQAFQGLVRQILSKSEAELGDWRDALRDALGLNGQLIVGLIPELEFVIGKQAHVPDLSPQDAQRRFRTVLRRFIAVFARREHPLALFLDDLQWLDAATLDLLEDLLTQGDIRHLLLIGAYRDNEVDAAHPLLRKLDAIRRAGASVQDIVLAPLTYDDLEQLISESLHCETMPANPLVQLVHEKTGGNPFFSIQFLSELADEALLVFDHTDARWFCDLGRIGAKRYTDNVIDLMVAKLNRLPAETTAPLRQLACVGSGAEFALLGTICDTSQEELHANLSEAVRAGLVLRSENSYAFQHDRIQEAAYSLVPGEARAEAHLQIGRLLVSQTPTGKLDDAIFEIVNQLNRASSLVTAQEEREQLAEFNLRAGKRARNAAAYSSALTYFAEGRALLVDDCWALQYPLVFELELHRAEAEFLTGEMASAVERLSTLAGRATNRVDQAAVACLHMDLYNVLSRLDRAVAVCLDYLRGGGVEWSAQPTDEEVQQEYERVWRRLGTRQIEDLIDLPLLNDADTRAILDVLTKAVGPSQSMSPNLFRLIAAHMVNLSLDHGNSDAASGAYVCFGWVFASDFADYSAALRFGQLGIDLVNKRGLDAFKVRVHLPFAIWISPRQQSVRSCRALILQASDEANKAGDLARTGYCYVNLIMNSCFSGAPLGDLDREVTVGIEFAKKTKSVLIAAIIFGFLFLTRTLRGLPNDLVTLGDEEFDEGALVRLLEADPNLSLAACSYWVRRLETCVFAGDYAQAVEAAVKVEGGLVIVSLAATFIDLAEYHFYAAMARAGAIDPGSASPGEGQPDLEPLTAHHRQLQTWAAHCPENVEDRAALVGAEIARLEGRDADAMRLYEQAIRAARANGFIHNEALAYETAARFYASRGFEGIAEMHLAKARDGYLRWGADGKVRQLEAHYPQLAVGGPRGETVEAASPDQQLDVAAVVKASQALSSEMLLPRLIERLMTIALQNAGADRGLLILPQQDDYRIEAEAHTEGERIVLHYGTAAGLAVPEAIIRYVMRTRDSVILDDATKQNLFSDDQYFGLQRPRSILCLPLVRQGTLVGLLYLENALAPHVFTPERARLLELLASQAAISLENTRLYGDLQQREAKIRRLVDANIIGIYIIEFGGRIVEANDAFLGMLGYEREDLAAGRLHWTNLTPPEWRAGDAERFDTMRSTGTLQPFEKEYLHKDGSRVPVLVGVARFEETGNQAVAFVVDLTGRKRAEAELAHANRVATMGQLTASIAHEINQPIAALLTNAGTAARWLARRPANLEKAKPLIDRIISDGKRTADIVSRIRDFSKKAPARKEDLEINEAILEIMRLARAAISEHGVSVKMQLSERLPHILGDRTQLQQVILNLIMNAIEAMSEVSEGSRGLVISTSETESVGVLVAVSDSGPGLPQTNPDRLFEAFYTTKSSGLGMGLSICRSIVEAHGGRLWATRNEPHGAVFCVMLPVGEKPLENLESAGS
jgi:PAS domain S-box-containing protein